jgi:transketolase C-terminal domain/subunit
MINEAMAASVLLESSGISTELIKLNRIHPLETGAVLSSIKKTRRLLVAEDVCRAGSIGSRLLAAIAEQGLSLDSSLLLDLGDGIIPQGDVQELLNRCGLDGPGIAAAALSQFPEKASNA